MSVNTFKIELRPPHHHPLPHEGAKYYGNVLFPSILSVTLKNHYM